MPRSLDPGTPRLSFGTTACLAKTSASVLAVSRLKYPPPVPVFVISVMMKMVELEGSILLIISSRFELASYNSREITVLKCGIDVLTAMNPMRFRNLAVCLLLVVELRTEIVLDRPKDCQKGFAACDCLV